MGINCSVMTPWYVLTNKHAQRKDESKVDNIYKTHHKEKENKISTTDDTAPFTTIKVYHSIHYYPYHAAKSNCNTDKTAALIISVPLSLSNKHAPVGTHTHTNPAHTHTPSLSPALPLLMVIIGPCPTWVIPLKWVLWEITIGEFSTLVFPVINKKCLFFICIYIII